MKLLYCPVCGDVRKLHYNRTTCDCGASWGHYEEDGLNAVYGGQSTPIGIANNTFRDAIILEAIRTSDGEQPRLGIPFEAFTIPECAPTIKRETISDKE